MQPVAPGVYVAPRLKKAVRERVWNVMLEWQELIPQDGGVVLLWKSRDAPSGLGVRLLGFPKKELVEHEGLWLTLRELTGAHDVDELMDLAEHEEPRFEKGDPALLEAFERPSSNTPSNETSEGETAGLDERSGDS
jgi:CRISPR-associated protein Cas2